MKRQKSDKHLDFIRSLPCVICGNNTATEAAHIRFADRRAAKRQTGMGEKPDDIWALPLCGEHHREQHSMGEREFWKVHERDPIFIALALHCAAGDYAKAQQVIESSDQSRF